MLFKPPHATHGGRRRHSPPAFAAALAALFALSLTELGCSRAQSSAPGADGLEQTEIRYQSSSAQVGFAELANDLGYFAPLKLVSVGSTFSGPADIQSVATGDSDIGSAFNGAIVKLVAAGAPIQAVVSSYGIDSETFGGFYVLPDSPIKTARELIGKKVAMNTLGAHSEFMLREYLTRNGLSPAEVKQVELIVLPPPNTEQALRAGQIDVAVLSNTLRDRAEEHGKLRLLFSDYELFGTFSMGAYVLRRRFIEDHPNTSKKLVSGIARAIEWARSTPRAEVVARLIAIAKKRDGNDAAAGILRHWRTPGIAGKGGLIAEREFTVWTSWLERDGAIAPGSVRPGKLYTNALSPFDAAVH
jgi:ABC-type nitrate/sulfonate/bicarbonate transport system substrate-binding protein